MAHWLDYFSVASVRYPERLSVLVSEFIIGCCFQQYKPRLCAGDFVESIYIKIGDQDIGI